jgi:outer membrane porin, OprD family
MSVYKRNIFFFIQASIFFFFLTLSNLLTAQENEISKQTDTTSLQYALRKGRFEAHFRLYYMSTNNQRPLTDYYALAFGGGVKYETGKFKNFQVGIGGFFIWNLTSSNLAIPDSLTGIKNRYEIGQFDMENPENKNDMDRLEDFYLKYSTKKIAIILGKQVIQTPFINPQDGRMRPTGEEGLWATILPSDKLKIYGGWLTKISPRGTVRWFDIDESIGVYPGGVNTGGKKSNYKGNLNSSGIGILGAQYSIRKRLTIQFWEQYSVNLFNTMMIQGDGERPVGSFGKLFGGFQYIFQNPLKDGGNADPSKTYFDPAQRSQVFGLRGGYQFKENLPHKCHAYNS